MAVFASVALLAGSDFFPHDWMVQAESQRDV